MLPRKKNGKRKEIEDKSNDKDDELDITERVDAIEEVNDVMNDGLDF